MDSSLFSPAAPGQLITVNIHNSQDWAFVPDPLPSTWELPPALVPLLTQAHSALGKLDGIGCYMPNYNLLLRPLQRREALRSSSLEGTYATPQQLLLFEIDPRTPQSPADPVNAWQEVWNYTQALELGLKLLNDRPISLNLLRSIHAELLKDVRGGQRDPGNFRRTQVHIGSDRRFIPPPANEIMPCLDVLERFIHQRTELDPLLQCFMVHYQFETIHPFLDGNGRVGRLLLSLMIYEKLQLSRPWLYLSAFFDRYRDEYIRLLFQVSSQGNWEDWIAFCLRGAIEQSQDSVKRFEQLLNLRSHYLELLNQAGGNIRLNRLIEYLFESPAVSINQWAEMAQGISYPTARADIDRLIKADILVESDISERPRIFFAPEILQIAYGEDGA